MRYTLLALQTKTTFGEVLAKSVHNTTIPPPGYDILEHKFNKQLISLRTFFKEESKTKSHFVNKDELVSLVDKYVNHVNNVNNVSSNKNASLNKHMNKTQRKMIVAAYAKAGRVNPRAGSTINSLKNNVVGGDSIKEEYNERKKLALLMKRNWPLLEYIAKEGGIEMRRNDDDSEGFESWGFEEELEENERNDNEKINNNDNARHHHGEKLDLNNTNSTGFNSFLRQLNKVHQTPGMKVLPKMTSFQAHPTISSVNVEMPDSEVNDFQNYLQHAKGISENRNELLFKAQINYEWSKNMMSQDPRVLENKTFFTPVCIPHTLIPIDDGSLAKLINVQDNLRSEVKNFIGDPDDSGKLNIEDFQVLKVYADGSSAILRNENQIYWDGKTIENIYKIMARLHEPYNFEKKLQKYIKSGWVPVYSDQREIVVVRNRENHVATVVKKLAVVAVTGVCVAFGVFSITTGL